MREFLTKSYRQLFKFLHENPGERFGVRELSGILEQSINTVGEGLRTLQKLGWIVIKIRGGPWHPALYELTEAGLKVISDFVSHIASLLRRQMPVPTEVQRKSDTTICPTCGHSQQHVSHASLNSESAGEEQKHKAYKLAPSATVEKANEIREQLHERSARARLYEIHGKPLDDFSVECMTKPLLRLPEVHQVREVLEVFEEKCCKEREHPKALHWGFFTRVITDAVANFVGRIPQRRPAQRAQDNDQHRGIEEELRAAGLRKA